MDLIEICWKIINFFFTNPMYTDIGNIVSVFAITGTFLKLFEGENLRKWFGTLFGLSCALLFGGFFDLCLVMFYGIAGSIVVAYADKRSCHKAAYICMFTLFTVYRVYEKCIKNVEFVNMEILNLQMMMLCKVIGVAHEINSSYNTQRAIERGEENVSRDQLVNPNLIDIMHYTFFTCWHGPHFTYRTYKDYLTLPFSRTVGISFTLKKICSASFVFLIFRVIEGFWPVEYGLTREFEESSFIHQTIYVFMAFQYATFGLYSLTLWAEVVYTSIGLGAYPVQGVNKTGHGPTENYSSIKKITPAEAQEMKYDFNTIKAMDIWTILTTPWMTEQVRGWNMGAQYFLWRCVRQQLPTTGPLKKYRMYLTGLVSAAWHGIEAGCYTGLLSIPACLSAEKPYKILIIEHLSGWKSSASLCFMYLFRVYIYGFAMATLCFRDFRKVYKLCSSTLFLPIIVFLTVHLLGMTIVKNFNERMKKNNNNNQESKKILAKEKRDKIVNGYQD